MPNPHTFFTPTSPSWQSFKTDSLPFNDFLHVSEAATTWGVPIPFWEDAWLIRLDDPAVAEQCSMWFIVDKYQTIFLDGTSQPIYAFMDRQPLPWGEANILQYLLFFNFFMRIPQGGPFLILESADSDFLPPLPTNAYEKLNRLIRPPSVKLAADDCRVTAFVLYLGGLYLGSYRIKRNGEVIMDRDKLLLKTGLTPYAPMLKTLKPILKEAEQPLPVSEPDSRAKTPGDAENYDNIMVRILESIEPSENSEVAAVLQRYEWLQKSACPLGDVPDLRYIQAKLLVDFPWFQEVTEWLMMYLTVKALGNVAFQFPPILLVGPQGIGKTAYANCIAELSKLAYRHIPLAGKSDSRDLTGSARSWGNACPAMPIRLINECRQGNPIILLDEIDKIGEGSYNGNIWSALHEFLEPESSRRFYDEYLATHANLSYVNWVATANEIAHIPQSLLHRFKVFRLNGPEEKDYPGIVSRVTEQFVSSNRLDARFLPELDAADWAVLKPYLTDPRSVRKAVEFLLAHRLANPKPGCLCH